MATPDYGALIDKMTPAGDPAAANDTAPSPGGATDQALASPDPSPISPAPSGPAEPTPANKYSAVIDLVDQARARAAKGVMVQNQDANPDVAGQAAALAPQVGVPQQAVEGDVKTFAQQAETARNAQILDTSPALANWIAANPDSARIAKDDFDKLSVISKAMTALKVGASSAIETDALARAYGDKAIGGDLGLNGAKTDAQIAGGEAALAAQPKLSGAYGDIAGGANFFTGLLDNFIQGQKVAAAGTVVGAGIGAAAGGVGAGPGAATGYAIGSGSGFLADMARVQAGETYRATAQMTDKDGNPLSEMSRQVAAGLVGVGTYAVGGLGAKLVGGIAADTVGKFMSDAATEAITRPSVQRAIGMAAANTLKGGLEGAGVMGLQEAVNISGEEIAKQISMASQGGQFATLFNDPLQRQEGIGRVADAMEVGALSIGLLHLPGGIADAAHAGLAARQAAADGANMGAVMDGAAASKTRGRSLDAFHSFLSSQADGSPVDQIFVNGDRVRELYQSAGIEPGPDDGLLGKVAPDIADQLQQSHATGGDVVLPMSDYVTHLAGTPLADEIKPDIRVRADGWSLREAQDYMANRDPNDLTDQVASAADQQEHAIDAAAPASAVYEDMFSKLRAAGYTVDTARQNAQLMAARYQTRAERLGGEQDAKSLYDSEGVDVQRVLPQSLEHVPVDNSDMVINALRNGSKQPSDRELFGPSLNEAIKERGGITDAGGDLKAMGAPKGLIRKGKKKAAAIGDLVGGQQDALSSDADYSPQGVAEAMHARGYFPDHAEPPEPDELRDAIGDEIAGNPRYAVGSTDERRAGFKQATGDLDQFLNEQGIDIKTASNAEIKTAISEYQKNALEGGREFDQSSANTDAPGARAPAASDTERVLNQNARGKITLANGKSIIQLFKGSDLSTALHEFGHLFLDELTRDAADAVDLEGENGETMPSPLKADMATVLKFLKVKSADEIGTEQHEQFARAFETYLMEGKAPSTALATAFRKFKSWLVTIYRTLQNLNSPISDNMRGVFDRLLASDDEIASAKARSGLNPIFRSAEDAGMTNAEWAAYNKQLAAAADSGDQRMLERTMVAVRAERSAEYKDQYADMRADVDRQVRSRQDLKAQYWLRTGKMLDDPDAEPAAQKVKLSRDALKDMYGNDEAPGLLPKGVFANTGGVHPDDVADLFGYADGDDLVKGLMNVETARRAAVERTGQAMDGNAYVRHLVDEETQRQMLERHGDPLNDGSIEDEALQAVHNAAQADLMAGELRILYRRAGAGEAPPLALSDIKAWVDDEIADMPIERGSNDRAFARQEAKAGRAVERALLKGDYREAFLQRQRQLVNHLMVIKAGEVKADYERAKKIFRRISQSLTIDTVDQTYLDQMHALLHRYGYTLRRDPSELLRGLKGEGLADFVARKYTEGQEPVVANILLDQTKDAPIDSLSVDHFMSVKDAIDSLRYLGREAMTVTIEGKRIQTREIREEILDRLDEQKQRGTSEYYAPEDAGKIKGAAAKMLAMLKGADASLLKQEQVFDWIDGGHADGPMNRYVFRRLKEAQHFENDRRRDIAEQFKALTGALGRDWQKGLDRFVPDTSLPQVDGTPYKFTRKRMLALALNVGNEGNMARLVDGHGWSEQRVMDYLNRNMEAKDWQFVQRIWDTFEGLRPEIDDLQRRVTGVGISFVKAKAFETAHGTMRGGYYPIVYDPARSYMAERHSEKATTDSLLQNQYLRATTPKGNTITRVENVKAPLNLDLDVIPWKIGQTIHDLAFREAVMDADKILSDKAVMGGVDKTFGPEYRKQFRPWLQDIANSRNITDAALGWMDTALRTLRTNATMVGIGFRFSTIFKHGSTALSNSVGELGIDYMRKGLAEFLGTPQAMKRKWDYVIGESAEMRNRMDSYDRDVRENLKTMLGETGLKANAQRFGHYGVAMADMMSAMPTWLGAYAKARDGGFEHGDAVYQADKLVRKAHGAQGVTDLAAIQRTQSEALKLMTMFYGFFNHIYNRQRNTIHTAAGIPAKLQAGDAVGARRDFAHVLAQSFYYVAIPAMVEALYTQGGPNQDKGETWGGFAAKAIASEIPAGLPVIRDIAKAAIEGRDYATSPIEQAINTVKGTGKDLARQFGWEDGEPSGRWLEHAIQTVGYASGWPTGQVGASAQYLWDVGNGDAHPQSIGDFVHGVMYGPRPKGQPGGIQ